MRLDVDLTDLNLAAAKMSGLGAYLQALRDTRRGFSQCLELAVSFVQDAGGQVNHESESTILELGEQVFHCFQPYPDIDLFYFEG